MILTVKDSSVTARIIWTVTDSTCLIDLEGNKDLED